MIRAREQVGLLQVEMDTFLQSNPARLSVKPYIQNGVPVPDTLVAVTEGIVDPPLGWSVKAAEIIYNLRSALDQLTYQLAWHNRAQSGKTGKPERQTYFPLFDTEPEYESFRDTENGGQKDPLGELSADAIALIERFLPFKPTVGDDPPNTFVRDIRVFSNDDKHKTIRATIQSLGDFGTFQVNCRGCSSTSKHAVWDMGTALQNDAEVLLIVGHGVQPDFQAQIKGHIPVQVTIEKNGTLMPFLSDAVEYVTYLIGHFPGVFT
jgi:hypothetical protein